MPPRPTTEQLNAFIRRYHNLPAIDVDQFWRSVAPEQMQLVARPVDILETVNFQRSVISGPSPVQSDLDQVFGPTDPLRGLVVRSIFWTVTGGSPVPDSVEIRQMPNNIVIWSDSAPPGDPLGTQNEPPGFGSRMPIVVMPGVTLLFRFHLIVPAAQTFRLDITGEEWETPIRNIGT